MQITDPLGFVSDVIDGFLTRHQIDGWLKLLFGFLLTAFWSFSGACGAQLIAHAAWGVAVGTGLVAAAGTTITLFMAHPKTRGIMVALKVDQAAGDPQAETLEKK